ncbi:hypothetical protein OSTOST_16420 [Ostertagia ostertagi]
MEEAGERKNGRQEGIVEKVVKESGHFCRHQSVGGGGTWDLGGGLESYRRDGAKTDLFAGIGGSNYELLESLLQGKDPEQVTLKELSEIMASHFQSKKLILAERYGLCRDHNASGEALQVYYAEKQKAAAT